MFARFRDENAVMDSGFVMPAGISTSGAMAGSNTAAVDKDAHCTLLLSDGRRLAWAEFGHRHGYPILYMHRQGGSRLEALLMHDAAKAAGFRLIAIDRPGLGHSDFFTFDDPALLSRDYIQLLDHLGLPLVAILSWGGGSRFALAMADCFPDRVSFLNLLSPRERSCKLTQNRLLGIPFRASLRLLLTIRASRASRDGDRYLQRWREHMCYADRQQIDDPEVGDLLAKIALESTRQGSAGLAQDMWFGMTAVDMGQDDFYASAQSGTVCSIPIHVWNGSADTIGKPVFARSGGHGSAGNSGAVVIRHWVRRQGHLFFRQAAGDIFRVARRVADLSLGVGGPLHR